MLSYLPFGIIVGIIYLIVAAIIGYQRHIPISRQFLYLVLFVYLMGVIAVTLFPIPVSRQLIGPGSGSNNNLIPFHSIFGMWLNNPDRLNALLNLFGNMMLFFPFGFLFPLIFKKLKRAYIIIPLSIAGSLIIESSQFIISTIIGYTYRSFDVDDLILNTAGAIIGWLILCLLQALIKSPHRQSANS